jgi:hypothetical protein
MFKMTTKRLAIALVAALAVSATAQAQSINPAENQSPSPARDVPAELILPTTPDAPLPGPKVVTAETCKSAPEVCKARKEELRRKRQACRDNPQDCRDGSLAKFESQDAPAN